VSPIKGFSVTDSKNELVVIVHSGFSVTNKRYCQYNWFVTSHSNLVLWKFEIGHVCDSDLDCVPVPTVSCLRFNTAFAGLQMLQSATPTLLWSLCEGGARRAMARERWRRRGTAVGSGHWRQ
jgi:hypothetical protein